jgi:alpha-maltose-1-phosphate synthase
VLGDGPGRDVLASAGGELVGTVQHAEVPELLSRCAVGLAPYSWDAPSYFSPLKVFEYLAAGLAVVAGDVAGVADVVGADSAIVIPRGDAPALARAVAELADDAERREALGRAGRALVASRHTWQLRAERLLALVAELSELGAAA